MSKQVCINHILVDVLNTSHRNNFIKKYLLDNSTSLYYAVILYLMCILWSAKCFYIFLNSCYGEGVVCSCNWLTSKQGLEPKTFIVVKGTTFVRNLLWRYTSVPNNYDKYIRLFKRQTPLTEIKINSKIVGSD